MFVASNRDDDRTVPRLKKLIRHQVGVRVAPALRLLAGNQGILRHVDQGRLRARCERHPDVAVNRRPARPTDNRGENRDGRILSCDDVLAAIGLDAAEVLAECRRLDELAGVPLTAVGDKLVYEGNTALFKSAGDEAYLIYRGVGTPSPGLQMLHLSFLKVLAALATASVGSPQAASFA